MAADRHVGAAWWRRFVRFHQLRHPAELGPAEVRACLAWLAEDRKVAASTQTQALAAVLGRQLERVRVRHQADLLAGGGWVELPDALGRKYPLAGRSWPWQWLVPATWQYRDRETGELRRRR